MRPIDALITLTWRRLLEKKQESSSAQTNNALIVNGSFFKRFYYFRYNREIPWFLIIEKQFINQIETIYGRLRTFGLCHLIINKVKNLTVTKLHIISDYLNINVNIYRSI